MKLSDLLAAELYRRGTRHVFGLTGGAVVHLFDSVARHGGMQAVFHHHEQAAAYALVANGRARGGVGVGIFTTGPGGTNALSGVAGAWMDSVPALFISGQARREHSSRGTGTRQVGTQELDIATLVQPMVKRAVMLERPEDILYELDRAYHEATTGRPGPVWLDIPLSFQWADVDETSLRRFEPAPAPLPAGTADVSAVVELLEKAERPLLVMGGGIRSPRARAEAEAFATRLGIPYVVTYNSFTFWPTDAPLNLGVLGLAGHRGANLAVQNCDLLLAVGTHLCVSQTGSLYDRFSPRSKRVVVNIDRAQLDFETVPVDVRIHSDAADFFTSLRSHALQDPAWDPRWLELIQRYAAINERDILAVNPDSGFIDQYSLVRAVADLLGEGDSVVIDGGGTNVYISYHALRVRPGQRVILSSGLCAMGSGMPESIGVAMATGQRTVCLVGDGSAMLNLQELQTIRTHDLPIKIIIFDNGGYVSIRQTQAGFLDSNFQGSSPEGGMELPDFCRVAQAFDIPVLRLEDKNAFAEPLRVFLEAEGPGVCQVLISPDQTVRPRQGFIQLDNGTFSPVPLDNMFPHLDKEEHADLSPWATGPGRRI